MLEQPMERTAREQRNKYKPRTETRSGRPADLICFMDMFCCMQEIGKMLVLDSKVRFKADVLESNHGKFCLTRLWSTWKRGGSLKVPDIHLENQRASASVNKGLSQINDFRKNSLKRLSRHSFWFVESRNHFKRF